MGKVWHYCVVVMDIGFFSGLASLGYTAVVMCMLMTAARAAGDGLVIEYLVCSGILYAALQSFLSF